MWRTIRYYLFEDEYYTMLQLRNTLNLLRHDYELVGTADDCKSIQKCISLAPDQIIADMRISDGQSIDELRARHCKIPVIVNTAYFHDEGGLDDLNIKGYLLKPASPEKNSTGA